MQSAQLIQSVIFQIAIIYHLSVFFQFDFLFVSEIFRFMHQVYLPAFDQFKPGVIQTYSFFF